MVARRTVHREVACGFTAVVLMFMQFPLPHLPLYFGCGTETTDRV